MFSISPCKTTKEKNLFENLPEALFRTDPVFTPPFPGSIVKYLSPKAAFNKVHGETHPFLAWRDGKVVGRIAAIINRTHNAYYKDKTGFFGFFECEDNEETALALLGTVEKFLKEHGCDSIRGPYNPSINDECGLLVEGFDLPTCIGMTWNPAYYANLVLASGMTRVRSLYGMHLALNRLPVPERLTRLVTRVTKRTHLKMRPINLKKLKEDLKVVHVVYNDTLERNWGFVPISLEDLYGAADDMKAIADPDMIMIAEREGTPAGVGMTLPNFNELLAKTRNTPHWLRLLHIVWLMKTYKIKTARQVVYGIVPEFRDRGLHAWLLFEQFTQAQKRFDTAELGWIEETNAEIIRNSEMLGAHKNRTWDIYEKPLA